MIGHRNRVLQAFAEDRVALGSLTLLQEPAIPEILGRCGYDFLIIDMEHAAADEQTVLTMVRAAEAAGVTPLVRLRRAEPKELLWALDTGAGGVVLPVVESGEQAHAIVASAFYPPRGARTVCSATRAAGHGTQRGDFDAYLQWAAHNVLTIGLVETVKGVEALDDILEAGIDVIMLGRADLSLDMGLGYAPWHPDVVKASYDVVDRVIASGATAGVLAYSPAEAQEWIDRGVRFVVYSQPEMMLSDLYASARREIVGPAS